VNEAVEWLENDPASPNNLIYTRILRTAPYGVGTGDELCIMYAAGWDMHTPARPMFSIKFQEG
jgi:hypothetical protein